MKPAGGAARERRHPAAGILTDGDKSRDEVLPIDS